MSWLVLNEYAAEIFERPDGLFAKFDVVKSRLVEQRLEVFAGSTCSRAFTARTTLIHVVADCDCWVEIVPSNGSDLDLAAGEERLVRVAPGQQLIVREAIAFNEEIEKCPMSH